MTRIEQIEKFLDDLDPKTLSMTDLKSYVDVAIAIDRYKSNKELLLEVQKKKEDRVIIPIPMV